MLKLNTIYYRVRFLYTLKGMTSTRPFYMGSPPGIEHHNTWHIIHLVNFIKYSNKLSKREDLVGYFLQSSVRKKQRADYLQVRPELKQAYPSEYNYQISQFYKTTKHFYY